MKDLTQMNEAAQREIRLHYEAKLKEMHDELEHVSMHGTVTSLLSSFFHFLSFLFSSTPFLPGPPQGMSLALALVSTLSPAAQQLSMLGC